MGCTPGAYGIPQNPRKYICGQWLVSELAWGWIPQFFQYVTLIWENYACCEFWLPKSGVDEMMQYAPVL